MHKRSTTVARWRRLALLGSLTTLLMLLAPLTTVAAAGSSANSAACVTFKETGKSLCDRFLDYWTAHGGLAINGFPLTEPRMETIGTRIYLVQWFERVRMEYHPEIADPKYQVLLGQFGRDIHPADPPVAAKPGLRFFAQTGHNMPLDLAAYWEANGGLDQFGLPLSEEIEEILPDETGQPQTYRVQYTERARFERHPKNPAPYNIQLGQFGRQLLANVWGATLVPLTGGQGYSDPGGKFSTMVPNGWTTQVVSGVTGIGFLSPDNLQACVVATSTAPAGTTIQALDLALDALITGQAGYEAIAKDQVVVQGQRAYRRVFYFNQTLNGTSVRVQASSVYYLYAGNTITATCFTLPAIFAAAAPTFDGIAGATRLAGIASIAHLE